MAIVDVVNDVVVVEKETVVVEVVVLVIAAFAGVCSSRDNM